jgi:tetratricopeptide (TPR) repeat protein
MDPARRQTTGDEAISPGETLWGQLREAILEARWKETRESYETLKEVLLGILGMPRAVEDLLRLTRKFEPQRENEVRRTLARWIEEVKATVERRAIDEILEERLVSRTLADLYFRQGHLEKAKRMYETLIHRDPDNVALLREYEERFREREEGPCGGKLFQVLSVWARRIKEAKGEGRDRTRQP